MSDEQSLQQVQPQDPAEMEPIETSPMQTAASNLLFNTKQLNTIFKLAGYYSKSSMVPANYQGNQDNCFVACELSARMNVSPMLVMQNLYIVQGKPAWGGSACVALVNGCGMFDPLEFVFIGERGKLSFGCYAQARRKSSGELIKGTTITMQMAEDEGWIKKNGSKWKTMPEQMLKYRAAAFFARVECPHVLMGFQTDDEVRDVHGEEKTEKTVISLESGDK